MQRRYLPSIAWLTAFEAVARLKSVTDAAAELDLSQGAVSRMIQKLEDQLNVRLFLRIKKRLVLTPQGAAYANDIRGALSTISNSSFSLATNPDGGTLELAILPAFGTHWLAPRLADFLAKHPGVSINLSTRILPFDFAKERFHAAIHFGEDDWLGSQSLKLMDENTVPVIAPRFVGRSGNVGAKTLEAIPLLSLRTRPDDWASWFAAQGSGFLPSSRMEFDQFAAMRQAAISGAGAALMPSYLVENDLEEGRLATVENAVNSSKGAYYLVWPETLKDYPPLVKLRAWIS